MSTLTLTYLLFNFGVNSQLAVLIAAKFQLLSVATVLLS